MNESLFSLCFFMLCKNIIILYTLVDCIIFFEKPNKY